jgi:hypothetical protein
MATVLRVDADSDTTTRYLQAFRHRLIFETFSNDWSKHILHSFIGDQAIEANVDACLKANKIRFISGAGHGFYDTFTAYQNRPLWSASQDLSFMKGIVVHLLSCQTAAMLGRSMIKYGAAAFWGYTVNFTFFRTDPPPADLSQDNIAEMFLKMDCIIDRGILKGRRAMPIYDSVDKYVAQLVPQLERRYRAMLLDNYLHLACPMVTWGDRTSTI